MTLVAGSAASSQVSTAAELVAALGVERLLGGWKVRAEGPGWLELEVSGLARGRGPVISVLVWPEVWRERASLAPHLMRARSGAYGLMLVGRDDEFAAVAIEELIGKSIPVAEGAAKGKSEAKPEAKSKSVGTVGPGEVLGEVAALTGDAHSATATAHTSARVTAWFSELTSPPPSGTRPRSRRGTWP